MDAPFAFTAQYWGNGAVVCRATEDRPGPIVEQQFGEFPSWTGAQNFATKLNEGLGLDPLEARHIVTGSLLATACVIQEALNSRHPWKGSRIERETHAAQLQLILSRLAYSVTLCHSVSLQSEASSLLMLANAHKALQDTGRFLKSFDGDYLDLRDVAAHIQELAATFQSVISCLPACLPDDTPNHLPGRPFLSSSSTLSPTLY